jgi:hypothetical protein
VKTLRVQVLSGPQAPETNAAYGYGQGGNPYADAWARPSGGTKRRVYFLLFVALTQPLLSWWLTYHLVPAAVAAPVPVPAAR